MKVLMLVAAALWGTLPARLPARPGTCDTLSSLIPETQLRWVDIYYRRFAATTWRLWRYTLPPGREGTPTPFPRPAIGFPYFCYTVVRDSANNVSCPSDTIVVLNNSWERP